LRKPDRPYGEKGNVSRLWLKELNQTKNNLLSHIFRNYGSD